ncbi:hypothetical protein ACQ4PT_033890 [Festuca glaucescens]
MPVIIGVLVMQLVSAMAASSPNKIGMANCTTSCGGVEVTYPFGIGPDSRCYLQPGFNLTCDTRHDPTRLLLLDGLRVDYIGESSIKVFHTVGTTPSLLGGALDRPGGAPYSLADGNELVLTGCNVQATLLRNGNVTAGSCSLCHEKDDVDAGLSSFMNGAKILRHDEVLRDRCSGLGCCLAPTIVGASHDADAMMSASLGIELHWFGRNSSADRERAPVRAFVAQKGWFDYWLSSSPWPPSSMDRTTALEVPVSLDWELPPAPGTQQQYYYCSSSSGVCSNKHSRCVNGTRGGYRCTCDHGYTGNAYIPDGCQVDDDCKRIIGCYGECIMRDGMPVCRCPLGTHGNGAMPGGCVTSTLTDAANCTRLCGGVHVPYPFGIQDMGPNDCYHQGFNLTCDRTHDPPQLLRSDGGGLQVVKIDLKNGTVNAVYSGAFINASTTHGEGSSFTHGSFRRPGEEPYSLSTSNELILTGCDAQASLLGSAKGPDILSGCVCFCSIDDDDDDDDDGGEDQTYVVDRRRRGVQGRRRSPSDKYCYGMGCCQARISVSMDGMPKQIHLGWLYPESDFAEKIPPPAYVFIAQEGWFDELGFSGKLGPNLQPPSRAALEIPMVLQWEVLSSNQNCSGNICKSKHSYCKQGDRGYTCHCETFFDGNPYVNDGDGCKDSRKKSSVNRGE